MPPGKAGVPAWSPIRHLHKVEDSLREKLAEDISFETLASSVNAAGARAVEHRRRQSRPLSLRPGMPSSDQKVERGYYKMVRRKRRDR
jgi:hypothetical protein